MSALQELFDYFENADEMVYISDAETNDLVFMNHCLRESLGCTDREDYVGKKCHKVLQDNDAPCNFCKNHVPEIGKFFSSIYENPELHECFIIKYTLLAHDGRIYRITTVSKINQSHIGKIEKYFTRREAVLNECLQVFFSTLDPDKSFIKLLRYIGKIFQGDRTYIFEVYENDTISNTYEWCAEGVKPQIDILKDLPISDITYWADTFGEGRNVEIGDVEEIRNDYPETYSLLKPQNIHSLVAAPIQKDGVLKGFMGIDNPSPDSLSLLSQTLKELGNYLFSQLHRRDLVHRFNKTSYRDLLTGAYNQNAMFEHNMTVQQWKSFGVVYCDINGLKETNETQGHDAGNKMIQECYALLKKSLHTEWIYRIGGDEFVALYYNVSEDEIKDDIRALRLSVMQSICQISIGFSWSDEQPLNTEDVLNKADALMDEEKETYYINLEKSTKNPFPRIQEKGHHALLNDSTTDAQLKLQHFLSNTYCDVSFLLTILGSDNGTSYFFFGDMQKNLYYISDNMRKKFGFSNNIVSDLINKWASRIEDKHVLKKFWADIHAVLEKKQVYHDLRYQITDVQGKSIWIRCFGKIQWNEDGTKPLFLSGRMTQQDENFIVDTLTNFPTETVLIRHLEHIQKLQQHCHAIGFSFHHISQINSKFGRNYGDELIKSVVRELDEQMNQELAFYRLTGMRCLALTEIQTEENMKRIVSKIKAIIDKVYASYGILLKNTCSFAVIEYPQQDGLPQDFIEHMILLVKVASEFPTQLYLNDSNENIRKMKERLALENTLLENIDHNMENFRIVIQPIVSAKDCTPIGGETLLRWTFQGKEISPSVFIPILEKKQMIHQVGRWVLEQAVHSCVRILTYDPDFYLTVNVSLQQLDDEDFLDFIRQTMMKYDLDGKHIVIELTESCMDDEPEKLERFVNGCKDMNIRIALDDFGSGYSSLRVLLRYPSSIIKLDRSLLLEMSDSDEKNGFITSIVYACHQFGKKVCMEGVETSFQNQIVKQAGCDLIQGYYYYKPIETKQIYQMIADKYAEEREA